MNTDEIIPVGLDTDAHNAWIEELKQDVEFEPLREFLDRLTRCGLRSDFS